MRDTFTSIFGFNKYCEIYHISKDNIDASRIVFEKKPYTTFHAKIIREVINDGGDVANSFYERYTEITIMTKDKVGKIRKNDKILMDGKEYRVVSSSFSPYTQNTEFQKNPSGRTIIEIRGDATDD